jgi:hypothetical protein
VRRANAPPQVALSEHGRTPRVSRRLEPVSKELHFDVNKPVIVEQSLHRRVAHRFDVENEILMNQSESRISGGGGGRDPFLYREGANLGRPHGVAIAGNRPISHEQFDLASSNGPQRRFRLNGFECVSLQSPGRARIGGGRIVRGDWTWLTRTVLVALRAIEKPLDLDSLPFCRFAPDKGQWRGGVR